MYTYALYSLRSFYFYVFLLNLILFFNFYYYLTFKALFWKLQKQVFTSSSQLFDLFFEFESKFIVLLGWSHTYEDFFSNKIEFTDKSGFLQSKQ